ncbi:hypothetical protein BGZ72_005861 [Mortierella alpina]|nr:hypothetical protein BGZ72_005861 [Mortierella alpina]
MSDPTYSKLGSFTRGTYNDPKTGERRMYFNLNHVFHKDADPISQLLLMARGCRPIGADDRSMNAHHINQEDHKNGGHFALFSDTMHDSKQLHNTLPTYRETQGEFRSGYRTVSGEIIRTMFAHIIESRIRHPVVSEAVRQHFLESPEYRKVARCAVRYQSAPKGGIEIMAFSDLPSMPICRHIVMSGDKKWLVATFNGTKHWLPVDRTTPGEISSLILSSNLGAPRLCVEIAACGPFYTMQMDGGLGQNLEVTKTMERADFLLGAMCFGRDAHTGVLFKPKKGQLPGYSNPILEAARLLKESPKWWDTWLELDFPKPCFRVSWRLVLVDLLGKQAFYDVPDDVDCIDAEAKILMLPYQALMESVRMHGAEWISSEPDLRKVDQYAKIFQLLSLARTSSNVCDIKIPPHIPRPPLSFFATVHKRADFRLAPPDSSEVDILGQALESAFTTAIVSNPDDLTRAAQYNNLAMSCHRQKKFDRATLHFLQAARIYRDCLEKLSLNSKSDRVTEKEYAKEGMRDNYISILDSVCLAAQVSTDWVVQKDETMYPEWWKPLQDQFGQALCVVSSLLKEPRFLSMDKAQSQIAAPLVVDVLLVHLAYEMLNEFEVLEDLDGIQCICYFMEGLYRKMEMRGIPSEKEVSGDVGCRWSSIKRVSQDLKDRLFTDADQADPFNVLEKVLQDEDADASLFTKQNQHVYAASKTTNHPLANRMGTIDANSLQKAQDGGFAQAERTIDVYFILGDLAASLACALTLVEDQHLAVTSTHADRLRLWAKVTMITECTVAQRNLSSARDLVQGVQSTLSKKQYKTYVMENKDAMLSYLTEACTLLGPCKRAFPRASEVLQGLVYNTMAMVHEAWFDSKTASKWTAAAKAREEAAKSESDDTAAMLYAREWLLDVQNKDREDSLKCTKEWKAMVAALA